MAGRVRVTAAVAITVLLVAGVVTSAAATTPGRTTASRAKTHTGTRAHARVKTSTAANTSGGATTSAPSNTSGAAKTSAPLNTPTSTTQPAAPPAPAGTNAKQKPAKSSTAGYVIPFSDPLGISTIQTTITLPAFGCRSPKTDLLVGIATDVANSSVDMICPKGGAPTYQLTEYARPYVQVTFPAIQAGDTVTLSLSCLSDGLGDVALFSTMSDLTSGATGAMAGAMAAPSCSGASIDVGSDPNEPLPNFGSLAFSNTWVDGLPLDAAGATPVNYYQSKKRHIVASGLFNGGTSFMVSQVFRGKK
jgi:hypothetical protein